MKENNEMIKYKDKKYKVVFDINVWEEIQKKYESIEKWLNLCDSSKNEINFEAFKFGLTQAINEGIKNDNEDNGTDIKLLTEHQTGRIISQIGLLKCANILTKSAVESLQSAEKNE